MNFYELLAVYGGDDHVIYIKSSIPEVERSKYLAQCSTSNSDKSTQGGIILTNNYVV
jgi:hypothetical protein